MRVYKIVSDGKSLSGDGNHGRNGGTKCDSMNATNHTTEDEYSILKGYHEKMNDKFNEKMMEANDVYFQRPNAKSTLQHNL